MSFNPYLGRSEGAQDNGVELVDFNYSTPTVFISAPQAQPPSHQLYTSHASQYAPMTMAPIAAPVHTVNANFSGSPYSQPFQFVSIADGAFQSTGSPTPQWFKALWVILNLLDATGAVCTFVFYSFPLLLLLLLLPIYIVFYIGTIACTVLNLLVSCGAPKMGKRTARILFLLAPLVHLIPGIYVTAVATRGSHYFLILSIISLGLVAVKVGLAAMIFKATSYGDYDVPSCGKPALLRDIVHTTLVSSAPGTSIAL